MRASKKIFVALAAAGIVAAGGSAFTATSTIDDSAINVGSVDQSVSGANFTNVVHTYDAANDTTTAISAHATELLSTTPGVVSIYVNGSATADAAGCTVTQVDSTGGTTPDSSDINCDITDTVNLTSIRFVVNG